MKNLVFIFILALILKSCSTISSTYDYDKSANFVSYKTYAFHQKGLQELNMNDLNKRRILENVKTIMNTKGFNFSDSEQNADLLINIAATSKEQTQVNTSTGFGFYPYRYWSGFGINNTWVNKYQEGTLTFDLIDSKTNTLIWQGISTGILIDRIEKNESQIQEAVQKNLKNFPPNSSK